MMKNITLTFLGLSASISVFAGTMGDIYSSLLIPLSVGVYGGYAHINGAYKQDGDVALERLALGMRLKELDTPVLHLLSLGIELGVQTGNTMRLSASQTVINNTGGLPVQSVLKPMIDGLVTINGQFSPLHPFGYILKGGIAYRQLQCEDRTSSQDTLNKINGEFQAGLGYHVTKHVTLTALYQGIYSKNTANVQQSSSVSGDTILSNIPTQQAGMIGVEYQFK